ncbi:MAG: hypothetical protein WCS67_06490 [Bacteroidales bacterium]
MRHTLLGRITVTPLSAAMICGQTFCEDSVIDFLDGVLTTPVKENCAKLHSTTVEKATGIRYFTIEMATDGMSGSDGAYSVSGAVLHAVFDSNDNYLKPNT